MEHNGYKINSDEQFKTMYRVAPTGRGGSIPTSLAGLFTSKAEAMKFIDNYKAQSKKKG